MNTKEALFVISQIIYQINSDHWPSSIDADIALKVMTEILMIKAGELLSE